MYRFSIHTQPDLRVNTHYGYGKSLVEIKKSLSKIFINNNKFLVENNSPRAKAQMYYGPHPIQNSHYNHQYKIHMSQIESSMFEPHKVNAYSSADEFWTANEWGANAAINSGIPKEKVFVFHHGIFSERYPAVLRGQNNKIRFLHIDSGSPRKRSDIVEDAFSMLYKKNKNIELTLKYSHSPHSGYDWSKEDVLKNRGKWVRPGIRHINETLSQKELLSLIHFHDVLVYPSEGEGFGLIPLEALATGMPVISTHEWSSYSKFFSEGHLESKIKPSTIDWGYIKLGNATITSVESTKEKMSYFIDNIDYLSKAFFNRSLEVKTEFDWNKKTTDFFTGFVDRVGEEFLKVKK